MTLAEIAFALTDPDKHGPGGTPNMSEDAIVAHVNWWNSLSAKERLLHGKR